MNFIRLIKIKSEQEIIGNKVQINILCKNVI